MSTLSGMGVGEIHDFETIIKIVKSLIKQVDRSEQANYKIAKKLKRTKVIEDNFTSKEAEMQLQIAQLNSENDRLKHQYESLKDQYNLLQMNQYKFQNVNTQNPYSPQLQAEIEKLRNTYNTVDTERQKIINDNLNFQKKNEELNQEISSLNSKLNQVNQTSKIMSEQINKSENEIKNLRDQLLKSETSKSDIIAENAGLKQKIEILQAENQKLSVEALNKKEIPEITKIVETTNNEQLINEIANLKSMISAQKQNPTDQNQNLVLISRMKASIKELQDKINDQDKTIKEKDKLIEEKTMKFNELQNSHNNYVKSMSNIKNEIKNTKKQLLDSKSKSSNKIKLLKAKYEELIKTLNQQNESKINAIKSECDKEINKIKKEYQEREDNNRNMLNDALQSQISQKELIERELRFRVESLESENRTLRDQSRKLSYALEQEEKELARLQVIHSKNSQIDCEEFPFNQRIERRVKRKGVYRRKEIYTYPEFDEEESY